MKFNLKWLFVFVIGMITMIGFSTETQSQEKFFECDTSPPITFAVVLQELFPFDLVVQKTVVPESHQPDELFKTLVTKNQDYNYLSTIEIQTETHTYRRARDGLICSSDISYIKNTTILFS